jgi:hypothetical protein
LRKKTCLGPKTLKLRGMAWPVHKVVYTFDI